MKKSLGFSIDRGGTFTDALIEVFLPGGAKSAFRTKKILSLSPKYEDAPREIIKQAYEEEFETKLDPGAPIPTGFISYLRMGTTVATNALLERQGEPTCFVTTKGFADVLAIGNQARPDIFALDIKSPSILYEQVVEVNERVLLVRDGVEDIPDGASLITGITGEKLYVEEPIDPHRLREALLKVKAAGIESLSVCLMHAFTFIDHEFEVKRIAEEIGFRKISLSHEVMPSSGIVPRGFTTVCDAYLTPKISEYVGNFLRGFEKGGKGMEVLFMQSDGGLTSMNRVSGHRAVLSGPAGGVVACASLGNQYFPHRAVLAFDMGGTSTDVSRVGIGGDIQLVIENTTAGVPIVAPQIDVKTVAAGGGSKLRFSRGLFRIGPDSCGALPGPACYGVGGPLAVSDANCTLGRIIPAALPATFGKDHNEPISAELSNLEFEKLIKEEGLQMTVDEVAAGFIECANEVMARPMRELTMMRGHDSASHALICFGGAGGQHGCSLARSLGISRILVHRLAGVLSAVGIALADIVEDLQLPSSVCHSPKVFEMLRAQLHMLHAKARSNLLSQGVAKETIRTRCFLNMRYHGTDSGIMIEMPSAEDDSLAGSMERFLEVHKREFGFVLEGRDVVVDDVRVRCVGKSTSLNLLTDRTESHEGCAYESVSSVFFDGKRLATPVFELWKLSAGHRLSGPGLLLDQTCTIVVEPGFIAEITPSGDVMMEAGTIPVSPTADGRLLEAVDPVQLSIFSHRFMSIAEQMGRTLQRTAISVNVKERLDFSCALFDSQSRLVANAPHIPVHLGAMQESVQAMQRWAGDDIKDGDVFVTNHPQKAGGSHLPDITVISPVFLAGICEFWVAGRAHHSDIGGITPGSMPPHSKSLAEEGAAIVAFKLVKDGVFQEAGIAELLMAPAKVPGGCGCRNLPDVIADLRAQVAANVCGSLLLKGLVTEYNLPIVQRYMHHIQLNAEQSVRGMLREFSRRHGLPEVGSVEASDFMDDGSEIRLKVTIDRSDGSACFDFSGTSPQVQGNWNCPPAVTRSAVLYCLRLLLREDVPLNHGCLAPIKIDVPDGCLLQPHDGAAVVGGNVLTSQRIVDVVLLAFSAAGASQGCMNNVSFGDSSFGYYETIAGGSGATSNAPGRSGTHVHMTNTRITDPETLERRVPVVLRQFSLRPGSGGAGKHRGGDGVVRKLQFRRPLQLSVLSERRVTQPYGLEGGMPGQRGLNTLEKGSVLVNIGGKASIAVNTGDVFTLQSPGGGGWGVPQGKDISR